MKRGTIVSVVAGYYFVEAEDDNKIYLCRGRGKLRKKASPLAGDQVYFSAEEEVGSVEEVLPRHNQLRRPAVANVDVVAVVLAAHSPQPNFLLVDKILALAMAQGMDALICVNKADLDWEQAQGYASMYDHDFETVVCSAESGQGLGGFLDLVGQRTVVLAGQSGVGKSRLISHIAVGELDIPLQIGEISAKIGRGKHTTRQVSLLPLASGGKVADTPGFSVLELDLESRELHRLYPEFDKYASGCKFSPCLHIHEPNCAVKEQVDAGAIHPCRYENYLKIYQELKKKEAQRY